ncbi:MAG: ABC transporter ATP-binding protein [Anaerolineaceae bacterium]|nr:ABC transporter ATP-binding protein [Anaerolineaceae bacterium]
MNLLTAPEEERSTMVTQSPIAIHLEDVSVRYRKPEVSIRSFKEFTIQYFQRRIRMQDFWALKNINLDILRGETFGIIGRNGAGKTTLLKVISRVIVPTKGRLVVEGEVAPLLECGAGFQPEMTGRENILLYGSLLGHSQQQIKEHIPEILDFAQLDGFIDAPLRMYSSGMIARLGFAVATSWKPQILILDEILAVGDEAFKKKCKARIDGFKNEGATILLVSHDMDLILKKCDRAALLEGGTIVDQGDVHQVVRSYRRLIEQSETPQN